MVRRVKVVKEVSRVRRVNVVHLVYRVNLARTVEPDFAVRRGSREVHRVSPGALDSRGSPEALDSPDRRVSEVPLVIRAGLVPRDNRVVSVSRP